MGNRVDGFLKWMKSFADRVNPSEESPVLLIVDGHSTHKELEVILFARSRNIHMLSLPPHTTHRLQPLDRVVMKPFKNAYNEACSLWMRKYSNLKISLRDICGLVGSAFTKVCRMELAQSGFACTGIYPLNPQIFSDLDFYRPLSELTPDSSEAVHPTQRLTREITPEPQPSTSKDIGTSESIPSTSTPVTSAPAATTTAGISSLNLSLSESLIQEICPLPSAVVGNFNTRKRRGDRSEILTSSPFKLRLEEKAQTKDLRTCLLYTSRCV